jgi:lipoyl(octanoyl) transferase
MRICEIRDLGRMGYREAYALQQDFVSQRKRGEIPDQLLFVEHPHVVTLGRNAHEQNLLAPPDVCARAGIDVVETNRGGDVTYHGPGQLVGYPIFDLKDWKRDVVAYVRALEGALIGVLAEFGIEGGREPGATGVWVNGAKIAAIGIHISRWITSHGFALNVDTNLDYFGYIVPCGLAKPVTSLQALGVKTTRDEVMAAVTEAMGQIFQLEMRHLTWAMETSVRFARLDERKGAVPPRSGGSSPQSIPGGTSVRFARLDERKGAVPPRSGGSSPQSIPGGTSVRFAR